MRPSGGVAVAGESNQNASAAESKEAAASEQIDRQSDVEEERRLIQQLQAGDHEAFETLFRRHFPKVYRHAFRLLGNAAETEEAVQEVFLVVYEKAEKFRGDSAFSTWLHSITVNAALSRLRRRKTRREVSFDEFLPGFVEDGHHEVRPVIDWSNDIGSHYAGNELSRTLERAIDQLRPVDKAVVVLSEVEGLSIRETGEALGLTVLAVKARLHRARLFLRGKLAVSLGYSPS